MRPERYLVVLALVNGYHRGLAPAPEKTLHPRGDRREYDADLFIRRGQHGPAAKRLAHPYRYAATGSTDLCS
jgi:hypothetical protein